MRHFYRTMFPLEGNDEPPELLRSIVERFSASPEERRGVHEKPLPEITSMAIGSPAYYKIDGMQALVRP